MTPWMVAADAGTDLLMMRMNNPPKRTFEMCGRRYDIQVALERVFAISNLILQASTVRWM